MSEDIYKQVEHAISEELYCADDKHWSGSPAWWMPILIQHGNIVMLWADCGREDRPEDLCIWTTDKWREIVQPDGKGLFRKVGPWNFEPANNPANDWIRYAHNYPSSAGRKIYELELENKRLLARVADLESSIYWKSEKSKGETK